MSLQEDTSICKQGVGQPLYSTALQPYPRTVAGKHYHQRMIHLGQRSPDTPKSAWPGSRCQPGTAWV
jgi:hypothetical protein